ncbi:MAG: hypothetical protein U1E65_27790 [Myxococcota bacterium]
MNHRLTPALLWLALSSTAAQAQVGAQCRHNPHLSRARDSYRGLNFEDVAAVLQRAIEYWGNCRQDLIEIYQWKGTIDALFDERERCLRDFEILLALDPKPVLPPDAPARVAACLARAQAEPAEKRRLELQIAGPARARPKHPVPIEVTVEDPLRLTQEVWLFYRRQGLKVFTVAQARADDHSTLVIPALALLPDEGGYRVEYFVRVVDRWGGTLAEVGSAAEPRSFQVSED